MPGEDDKPRDTLTLEHGAHRLSELAEAATEAEGPSTEPGDGGDTEVGDRASTRHMGSRSQSGSRPTPSLQGYEFGAMLGRGGMGEVIVAHDQRIGRDVAVKRLRGAAQSSDLKARFLREARIQARLDHPAIVPVYELGYDDDGQPFFTMKKVAGVTLTEVLASPSPPPRPRLLRAFVELCHAVEFAHERGVVHRDLKPSNIIVGRFNEIYILDWGLARVMHDAPDRSVMTPGDVDSLDGLTLAGALLGTPGYMAPEQARGEPEIGRAADVYALGSILFEILAGETLHPKGERALASTMDNETVSPAARRPDRQIPPELDAICAAAIVTEPDKRPSTADLAERIERYLDGDRDVARRRELATEHIAAARNALASNARVIALRAAGRALALDPESRDAAALVTGLILEPPRELPLELQRKLEAEDIAFGRRMGRTAAITFVVAFCFLPFTLVIDVLSWPVLAALFALFAVLAVHAEFAFRKSNRPVMIALVGMVIVVVLLTRVFGSLIFVPGFVCAATLALTSYPSLIDRPVLVIGALFSGVAVPLLLEATGVWTQTWWIADGKVETMSTALRFDGAPSAIFLLTANLLLIAIGGWFARSLAMNRRDAQRRLEIQAWHLRQLLPTQ